MKSPSRKRRPGLGDKIRVVELDPDRLARIESNVLTARVLQAHERSSRQLLFRLAPLPLLSAAVAALLVLGIAHVWNRDDGAEPAAAVPEVVTDAANQAQLHIGEATVVVSESSKLAVRPLRGGAVRIELDSGRVDCDVVPRPHRPHFFVRASDVEVKVVGTAFSVERRDHLVRVQVTRGKVQITRGDAAPVLLTMGHSWTTTSGVSVDPPSTAAQLPKRASTYAATERRDTPAAQTFVPRVRDTATSTASRGPSGANPKSLTERPASSRISIPQGLPPIDPACAANLDECERSALQNGVEHARELYTVVYVLVKSGGTKEKAKALTYVRLYERRFATRRGDAARSELRAVQLLRRAAEASE